MRFIRVSSVHIHSKCVEIFFFSLKCTLDSSKYVMDAFQMRTDRMRSKISLIALQMCSKCVRNRSKCVLMCSKDVPDTFEMRSGCVSSAFQTR
jgi:hypothetical protein